MCDIVLSEWKLFYRDSPTSSSACPAIFLDRDGVIIEDVSYISDPEDVRLIAGVAKTIENFRSAGFKVVVVTNQSGVARGYFNREAYLLVEGRIRELLGSNAPDAVYACPFHRDGHAPYNVDHSWRKPGDGMLRTAAVDLNLDLSKSIMVGDNISDIEAGLSAGVSHIFHVLTGHGAKHREEVDRLLQSLTQNVGEKARLYCVDSIAQVNPEVKAS
ncbi:D-glycero-D-manno-heptose 1,7-bisphosphate phosphatase (plasmid) [Ensifer sp. WSM1721]|uniref:D-glycero-alpha-D-manno-heptose-1,7-bisphosphate 7-phosphatase n=1 Tax=Ensifer sp. WSM1721 TaxID=1041159 RepID=UPI000A025718|nr:HAD family hydrolase [Ensifer sp. WSM1721]